MTPKFQAFIVALLLFFPSSWSQVPGGSHPSFNPILSRLFGDLSGFSAEANVHLTTPRPSDSLEMPMTYQFLQGKMRAEIDMTKVKSEALRPEMIRNLKGVGMDKVITIAEPKTGLNLILYPGLLAYLNTPSDANPASTKRFRENKIKKIPLNKEAIGGFACQKYEVQWAGKSPGPDKVLVWEADELDHFPIQITMTHQSSRMSVTFQNVQLKNPDPEVFQTPKDYTQYETLEKVMEAAVKKLLAP